MRAMLKDEETCDVTLIVGEMAESVKVHGSVLKAASPYFRAMFSANRWAESETKIVKLPQYSSSVVRVAVEFMYTGLLFLVLHTLYGAQEPALLDVLKNFFDIHDVLLHLTSARSQSTICPPGALLDKQTIQSHIEAWQLIQERNMADFINIAIERIASTASDNLHRLVDIAKSTSKLEHLKRILKGAWEESDDLGFYVADHDAHGVEAWLQNQGRGDADNKSEINAMKGELLDMLLQMMKSQGNT
ncbi:hypothetical protein HDV00_001994 [Rhizophlyctis rosea]|nr:hypothetical protein HDV00_001994 [Rhizophlyctis rosea]